MKRKPGQAMFALVLAAEDMTLRLITATTTLSDQLARLGTGAYRAFQASFTHS